eukprot:2783126-Amphidinium_carterae.1
MSCEETLGRQGCSRPPMAPQAKHPRSLFWLSCVSAGGVQDGDVFRLHPQNKAAKNCNSVETVSIQTNSPALKITHCSV